jgi:hypothetical protein
VGTAGLVSVHRDQHDPHRAGLTQGESFNGWARDELLNIEEFDTLTEARVISKPEEWSKTPIGPTRPLAGSRPSNSNGGGPNNTNPTLIVG